MLWAKPNENYTCICKQIMLILIKTYQTHPENEEEHDWFDINNPIETTDQLAERTARAVLEVVRSDDSPRCQPAGRRPEHYCGLCWGLALGIRRRPPSQWTEAGSHSRRCHWWLACRWTPNHSNSDRLHLSRHWWWPKWNPTCIYQVVIDIDKQPSGKWTRIPGGHCAKI